MLCGWCAVYSYIYSLVDPDDISIHWANVLNVMEDGNAEEDEGKDPNEQKQEEGDQEGTVSKLVSGLCCDDVSTKLTLVISHRVLLPSHSRRHLLHNRHLHTWDQRESKDGYSHVYTYTHTRQNQVYIYMYVYTLNIVIKYVYYVRTYEYLTVRIPLLRTTNTYIVQKMETLYGIDLTFTMADG